MAKITLTQLAEQIVRDNHITLDDFVGTPERSDVFENLCSYRLSRALIKAVTSRKPSTLGVLAASAQPSSHQNYWFRKVQIPERIALSPIGLVRHAVLVALLAETQQMLIRQKQSTAPAPTPWSQP